MEAEVRIVSLFTCWKNLNMAQHPGCGIGSWAGWFGGLNERCLPFEHCSVCLCIHHVYVGPHRGQKRVLDSPESEIASGVSHIMWLLGIKLWSSEQHALWATESSSPRALCRLVLMVNLQQLRTTWVVLMVNYLAQSGSQHTWLWGVVLVVSWCGKTQPTVGSTTP